VLSLLTRIRSEEKFGLKWQIRIGDYDHKSTLDDFDVQVLDITDAQVHPSYDGVAAYFDIGILKTAPIMLNKVSSQSISFDNEALNFVTSKY